VPFTGAYALEGQPRLAQAWRQLAESFDTRYLVLNQVPTHATGGSRLCHVATRATIPAALVEAGELGRMDEPDVRFIADSVRNAMRVIGILDEPVVAATLKPMLLEEIEVYAHATGLFDVRAAPGDAIVPRAGPRRDRRLLRPYRRALRVALEWDRAGRDQAGDGRGTLPTGHRHPGVSFDLRSLPLLDHFARWAVRAPFRPYAVITWNTVVAFVRGTQTETGLVVQAILNPGDYPTGQRVSDADGSTQYRAPSDLYDMELHHPTRTPVPRSSELRELIL
jgi:hypothetical protein